MARKPSKVPLLSGGNPQIAMADGEAPVRAFIAAMPGWKRDVGRRLDRLICTVVPQVCRAVKWNSPLYGIDGRGYFLGYHCLTKYVKVAFFRGAELKPLPPGVSTQANVRYFHVFENTPLDEGLWADWIRQAAALDGWVP